MTPAEHIAKAEAFARRGASTMSREVGLTLAALAQAHAQIASAQLLSQATEGSGALKVSAEVDR